MGVSVTHRGQGWEGWSELGRRLGMRAGVEAGWVAEAAAAAAALPHSWQLLPIKAAACSVRPVLRSPSGESMQRQRRRMAGSRAEHVKAYLPRRALEPEATCWRWPHRGCPDDDRRAHHPAAGA